MIPPLRPALVSLLTALPPAGQQRLIIMGWSADGPTGVSRRLRDPERALRRADSAFERASIYGRISWAYATQAEPDHAWRALARAFGELGEHLPSGLGLGQQGGEASFDLVFQGVFLIWG